MSFRRPGFEAQETMDSFIGRMRFPGPRVTIGEEYIFTARKGKKARKCETFSARASLAGRASGGRDWRLGRRRFLEALDHSVSPSPLPFCSVPRAGPRETPMVRSQYDL